MAETTEEYRNRINQLKTSIENEPYIQKMRENIAEGISKTGNRQADIEVRQDTLEDDFVAVQQDASSASPSGAEVAVARAGFNTLDERLTTKEQQVNAQLAQKPNEDMVRLKTENIGLNDTSPELLSAIEGGEGTSFNLLSIPREKSVTPETTDFIGYTNTVNIFDKRGLTNNTGISATTGLPWTISGYSSNLDYRPIKPNVIYSKKKNGDIAFYTADFVFISGVSSPANSFTTPTNTALYRTTTANGSVDEQMIVEGSVLPTEYIPYRNYYLKDNIKVNVELPPDKGDSLNGLLWDTLGDSTTNDTYGKPYHQHIKDRTGIVPINYGVNQTSISVREGLTNSLLERYISMDSSADIITVMGGRNDITFSVPIGTMSDRVDNTIYGACHLLFSGLIEKFKGKKIGVILPLQRSSDTANTLNYVNAIREVAEYYSIPVLDLYRHSGLTPRIQSIMDMYMPDGLHPNSEGHNIISRRIEAWLRTL